MRVKLQRWKPHLLGVLLLLLLLLLRVLDFVLLLRLLLVLESERPYQRLWVPGDKGQGRRPIICFFCCCSC